MAKKKGEEAPAGAPKKERKAPSVEPPAPAPAPAPKTKTKAKAAAAPEPEPKAGGKAAREERAAAKKGGSRARGRSLVIVESPAKAKTINKILGTGYVVKACYGHVRDLPKRDFGVDVEHSFTPKYINIRAKKQVIDELKSASKVASAVFLAPDPDREGEAIAWHLVEALQIPPDKARRVTFNEITKKGVLDAFTRPGQIVMDRVYAQQARRLLDRIVGYELSPLLSKKITRGLSAGRVQSVAVRLVVEREHEIRAFKPKEYWTITAHLSKQRHPQRFRAELVKLDDRDAEVGSDTASKSLVDELQRETFVIETVARKERQEHAPPPFTTSLLQQQASIKLRFTTSRAMRIAQQLYEGVDIGDEGTVGLITYMRTDSFRVADEAVAECRAHIERRFGRVYLPEKPPVRAAKKGAQEAHEAIRPTSVERTPESVKAYLTDEQFRLYRLIWRRFVASQMRPAVYLLTEAAIRAGRATFSARGRELKFDGYTKLTSPWAKREDVADMLKEFEGEVARVLSALKRGGMRLTPEGADVLREAAKAQPDAGDLAQALAQVRDQVLPPLEEKETLQLHQLDPVQHFTEPPPRYTEASLVRTLEKHGIGRPSTYAPIITTIQDRGYAVQDDRKLRPTELGELVTQKLVQHFHDIMDTGFTGEMEEKLDLIEDGKANWVDVLRTFYDAFIGDLDKAQEGMESVKDVEPDPPVPCDKCQRPMVIKWNRYGRFYGCRAYPECRSAKPLQTPEAAGEKCERCGADMIIKAGRFGRFLACSKYPDCRNTRPVPRGNRRLAIPPGWKMTCPQCSKSMWVKYGRRGPFIACEGYPDCRNTERVPKEWFVTIKPDGQAGAGTPEPEEPDDESEGENGQG